MPRLPHSPLETSAIGIGCAHVVAGSPTRHDQRLIAAAFEAGARHFDTAPQYGLGTSEEILGQALAGKRDQVTIATKAGFRRPHVSRPKLLARALLAPVRGKVVRARGGASLEAARRLAGVGRVHDMAPDTVVRSLEDSLRRLQTDYVDAFLLHMARPEHITEEMLRALEDLRASGKARALGIATERADAERILAAHPQAFEIVQHEWSVGDPPLQPSAAFRIVHGALRGGSAALDTAFGNGAAGRRRLSQAAGMDLHDGSAKTRTLIGAALEANAGGIVLVASRSIERTRSNVAAALDPRTAEQGACLLRAFERERNAA